VSEIEMLTDSERHLLLSLWSESQPANPAHQSIQQLFEEQVERNPEALAIIFGKSQVSYGELNRKAGIVAGTLAEQGVEPETIVAIMTEQGVETMIAIMGVLKAGGAYLLLNSSSSTESLAQVIEHGGCSLVLVTNSLMPILEDALANIQTKTGLQILSLENTLEQDRPAEALSRRSAPNQLACVLYDYDAEEALQGFMVEHEGLVNHLNARISVLLLSAYDKVTQLSQDNSERSVWSALAALMSGGTIYFYDQDLALNPSLLWDKVDQEDITVLELAPSLLRESLAEAKLTPEASLLTLSSLRRVVVQGEDLTPELVEDWLELYHHIPLLACYDFPACSGDVAYTDIRAVKASHSIGTTIERPASNMRAFVLDSKMRLVPAGIGGELHIGGVGVSRGYLGDAQRTARDFVADPYGGPGARMFKTGDYACYLPDGSIMVMGRMDHLVEMRGMHINLDEVERVLVQNAAVRRAAVVLREARSGEKHLAAYLESETDQPISPAELRRFAEERLSPCMVPTAFIQMDHLPLSPGGKIDRRALPEASEEETQEAGPFIGPRSPTEEAVAGIWKEVLERPQIGIQDKFFDIGGDSLKVIRVFLLLNDLYPDALTVVDLFKHNTIESVSAYLEESYLLDQAVPAIHGFEL
jgi:amino acid adenylation domain-containing protein